MLENAATDVEQPLEAAAPEEIPVSVAVTESTEEASLAERPIMVEFKNVSKRYKLYSGNLKRVLGLFSKRIPHKVINANNDLNFTIRKGESVALLGANGAGKSTCLKMITGVTYPTEVR